MKQLLDFPNPQSVPESSLRFRLVAGQLQTVKEQKMGGLRIETESGRHTVDSLFFRFGVQNHYYPNPRNHHQMLQARSHSNCYRKVHRKQLSTSGTKCRHKGIFETASLWRLVHGQLEDRLLLCVRNEIVRPVWLYGSASHGFGCRHVITVVRGKPQALMLKLRKLFSVASGKKPKTTT